MHGASDTDAADLEVVKGHMLSVAYTRIRKLNNTAPRRGGRIPSSWLTPGAEGMPV
ncbi:MAG: hypothetical protein Kow0074_05960 [Candidatus Zixiibacteriota bacterium]